MSASIEMDHIDQQILDILQKEFPLVSRPFAALANNLSITEEDLISRIRFLLYEKKIIREISAIFDSKRLGYESCLVAMQIPPDRLDAAAALINEHPGVSHNYSRSHTLNLWFTIAIPNGHNLRHEVNKLGEMVSATATLLLPSLRMFKLGVRLDITGTRDPLSMENEQRNKSADPKDEIMPDLTEKDIKIIRELQKNIPLMITPFKEIAGRINIPEEELFDAIGKMMKQGRIRRFAAVLRHRDMGFKANAMGVWIVPPEDIVRTGTHLARFQSVTHCYERPACPPLWPYNLYTMVHTRTRNECIFILQKMSEEAGIKEYHYLFSEKEYKKARVRYFKEQ